MANKNNVTGWVGWVYFAAFMMMFVGIFQSIMGFVALFNDTYFFVGAEKLLVLDYTTWGWVHLIIGLLILFAGLSLSAGKMYGRVVGIIMVILNMLANMAFINAHPWWSVIVIAVDVIILYALIVHGKEAAELE